MPSTNAAVETVCKEIGMKRLFVTMRHANLIRFDFWQQRKCVFCLLGKSSREDLQNRQSRHKLPRPQGDLQEPLRMSVVAITESTAKFAPAYVSFPAFLLFLDRLAEGLPDAIDRSIMTTMSGAAQGQLLTSLKFLGLIEDDCSVTGGLKSLVDSKLEGDAAFRAAMKDLSASAYASVLGEVDILLMTPRQLADRFREAGADGSTLVKAIRFYLSLLDASGVPYPKHFSQSARSATPNGKKPEVRRPKVEHPTEEQQKPPAATEKPNDYHSLLHSN